MKTTDNKTKGYSWFRRPKREDFTPNLSMRAMHLAVFGTSVNPKNPGPGVAKAVDNNTHKLDDLMYEYRYQSAFSDWKANVAITIAIASMVFSIVISIVSCAIAHHDSNTTTRSIVAAIENLKGTSK